MLHRVIGLLGALLFLSGLAAAGQRDAAVQSPREIAEQFAPVFVQELGKYPKYDYPTKIDFAGDLEANRNWSRAPDYPLPAYVYYSLVETETHYFILYCLFYPRDWKGGTLDSRLLSFLHQIADLLDPTRVLLTASLSHENDFEGMLVVIEKSPEPHAVMAESLAHFRLRRFATEEYLARHRINGAKKLFLANGRPLFAVESKGHGVISPASRHPKNFRVYEYARVAEDPEKTEALEVGYELKDVKETFWDMPGNQIKKFFAKRKDYSRLEVMIKQGGETRLAHIERGKIGTKIRGCKGMHNFARLPWDWEALTWKSLPRFKHKDLARGAWFFDPASVVKKHFGLDDDFSTVYLFHPYVESPKNDGN